MVNNWKVLINGIASSKSISECKDVGNDWDNFEKIDQRQFESGILS